MKKALIIAYQFPPMGGSGVQRTVKFVKYLRGFGWEPVVLTRETGKMPLKDESLLKDVPAGVKVVRTSPFDLTELPGILGLFGKAVNRKVLIPDGERLWQLFSINKAGEIISEDAIDLVYTTSYPYSDHLMGLHIKTRFPHIPWVADFRDEWTKNPYLLDNPHNAIRTSMEEKMEKKVLKAADHLIANTPVMLENFIRNDESLKQKFHVIPNGFDEDDFTGTSQIKPCNSRFTISYTGAFYGRRKPDVFFEALKQLIDDNKIERGEILVRLIGNFKNERLKASISKYALSETVEVLPYMEHAECIRNLVESDALLLIEGAGPGAEAFYTGKIFEYMNTGRPVIAVIPYNGAAARLIGETGAGFISDSADVGKTGENILYLYMKWKEKSLAFSPDWDKIKAYSRKALTGKLAKVFEEALMKA